MECLVTLRVSPTELTVSTGVVSDSESSSIHDNAFGIVAYGSCRIETVPGKAGLGA